ncbi:hypothetical protein X777_13009 [Ooceraea biroi]|uniref:Histone-lysine N-methyltransferase SETMAR n=2 Tax=Ooceraea biroi TaxID=2015173 RepID=A0A026W059_OOCBI|nr:hypothetical protein X777_13009 [Ooceraea biroi]
MITGDEKWIVYNNVKRKRSWSKRDEHAEALEKFFERGIMKLPEKWQKIIKQNGQYIV